MNRRRQTASSSTRRLDSRRLFLEGLEDRALLATVVTDKPDYAPSETALITASGYQPGETVKFQVLHIDGTPNTGNGHDPWNVQDGSAADLDGQVNGNISTSWFIDPDDSLGATFELSALGLLSGLFDTYVFTDAAPPSNGNLFQWDPGNDPDEAWVTGNNDGLFFEGDTVPYYTDFHNLVVGDEYSITIEWDTTKSGKHAIDYLRSYDATITFPPAIDPAVQAGVTVQSTDFIAIPEDTFMTGHPTFNGTQLAGQFKMYNGDMTAVSPYDNPLTYLGDTSTSITITFTALEEDVVLTWGGHIATRQDWGLLNSAVNIPGSPYHMRLESFFDETNDEALGLGNTDRSLSAEAVIFPAIITIIKDAIPNDQQDFAFTTTGTGLSPFTLDDDAGAVGEDNTFSNQQQFSVTNFDDKTITEALVAGWDLTSIQIVELGGTSDSTFDLGTRTASLEVQEGEIITVTYTNTRVATVTLVKNSIGGNDTFDFDGTGGLPTDIDITTVGGTGSQVFTFNTLPAGGQAASVTELLANLPAGWNFTNLQVTGDDDFVINNQTATLNIEPGENIVVTYTNTKDATVRVVKSTIGGDATFNYDVGGALNGQGTPAVPDPLSITTAGGTGQSALFTFSNLPAAGQSLSFDELALAGWTFTSVNVSGDAGHSIAGDLATLDVDPGETIVVTYTNTKDATVRVIKNTVGGDATFSYDVGGTLNGQGSPAVPDPLNITTSGGTGQSALFTFANLPVAGQSLSFDEFALAGWTFNSVVVSGDAGHSIVGDLATLDVDPGETIVVTYTNTKDATVRVIKNTVGGDATFSYDVGGTLNGQGSPAVPDPLNITTAGGTGQSALFTFSNLPAAGQSLSFDELALAGWSFTSVVVSGDADHTIVGDLATLDVDPGETIVVTYTNSLQATITIVKNTIGGDATFDFDGTGLLPADFDLITVGGTASQTFAFDVPIGGSAASVTEPLANLPAGWNFTNLQVVGDDDFSIVNQTATLNLEPGENIIVTYTNTRQATVRVIKTAIGGDATFSYDVGGALNGQGSPAVPDPLNITTAGGTGQSALFTFSNLPAAGQSLSFDELALAGWTFTSVIVSGDANHSIAGDLATLDVDPGETIVVTYTNTKDATVRVIKNSVGGDATFDYDVGGALNGQGTPAVPDPLSITTAGGTGQSALFTFSNLPAAGQSLSFDELALAGWTFTSVNVSGDAGHSIAGDLATLDVDPGETIVVTYTNTKDATVLVVKNTIGGDATFQYGVAGALVGQGTPPVPIALDISTVGGMGNSSLFTFSNLPAAGASLVFDELPLPGWSFTSVTVSGDAGHSIVGDVAGLDVDPGETIIVTYTNTKDAIVRVIKNTIGGDATFQYDVGGALNGQGSPAVPDPLNITTAGGTGQSAAFTFSNLPFAGQSLSFDELALPGWTFTSVVVGGDSGHSIVGDVATLDVDPGEIIVVTYTNTKDATVRVVKNAVGGDATFSYDVDGQLNGQGSPAVPDPLDITTVGGTGQSALFTFSNLPVAGQSLSFDEQALAAWNFTSVVVSGDAGHSIVGDVATLNVSPGETIVVTYTNTKQATVLVVKNAVGGDGTFEFDVDGALNGQGSPAVPDPLSITTVGGTGQSDLFTFTNLPAGGSSLSFNEIVPSGWTFNSVQISGGDADDTTVGTTATLNVEPGETIVVTYTNTKKPTNIIIAPDKQNCSLPYIHIVNSETGEILVRFKAYDENKPDSESYLGGIRVATGDLNGDGEAEIVTVPGRGYQPLVRIWDQQGNKLKEFLAFSSSFVGGVDIAVGDAVGNGFNDIAVAMNYNGNQVKVFRNTLENPAPIPTFSTFSTFYPFGSSYKGGATIELADMGTPVTINSVKQLDPALDGKAELVIGSETSMAPTVKIFSYFGTATTPSLVRTMFPFDPAFRGGMSLDVARINADLIPDIIVGAGNGGASQVQILDGLTGAVIGGFTAFTTPPSNNAPVDVAAQDQTGDGIADVIFVVQGSDGDVREVRMFDAQSGQLLSAVPETSADFCGAYFVTTIDNRDLPEIEVELLSTGRMTRLLPYGPVYFGGVHVATGDLNGDGIEEIVTSPDRNYKPLVRVFDQSGKLLKEFLAYSSSFKGGLDVAIGDVTGDGKLDIATSMLYGGNQVKVFKNVIPVGALTFPSTSFSSFSSFYPFGSGFKGGAVIELADMGKPVTVSGVKKLDSTQFDGKAEVVVANGSGMRSTVKAYTYFGTSTTASLVRTFLPFNSTFRGGLSLDLGDVNGDLVPDVFIGAGKGGASQVQVLDGVTGAVQSSFQAFSSEEFNYNAKLEVEAHDADLDGIIDFLLAAHDFDGKSREVRRFQPLSGELVDAYFQDYSKI